MPSLRRLHFCYSVCFYRCILHILLFFVGCLHHRLLLSYGDEHAQSADNEHADETELDDPSCQLQFVNFSMLSFVCLCEN